MRANSTRDNLLKVIQNEHRDGISFTEHTRCNLISILCHWSEQRHSFIHIAHISQSQMIWQTWPVCYFRDLMLNESSTCFRKGNIFAPHTNLSSGHHNDSWARRANVDIREKQISVATSMRISSGCGRCCRLLSTTATLFSPCACFDESAKMLSSIK